MTRVLLTSLTRITGLEPVGESGALSLGGRYDLEEVPRSLWATGDYVVGRVVVGSPLRFPFELQTGRMAEVGAGDLVLGALGRRAATLEAVGDWRDVGDDCRLDALTGAGLFGRVTSKSDVIPDLVELHYAGHFRVDGRRIQMTDFVRETPPDRFDVPVILIVGSSMSAGKTATGRSIVRMLCQLGHRVVAAKLTGAARYRDVLSLGDAGAEWIFDFVDAGLPSTVCDADTYRHALDHLLARMAAVPADVAVFEAGASPLEPYNGAVAIETLDPHVACTVLCASDPYSVVGIVDAFGRRPDLVAGIAGNTEASIALVDKLTGIRAMDARSPRSAPTLRALLEDALHRAREGRKSA